MFIVSMLSLVGLLAFPFLHKKSFQNVLALFTALAVATLLGDAVFHLIPFVGIGFFDIAIAALRGRRKSFFVLMMTALAKIEIAMALSLSKR